MALVGPGKCIKIGFTSNAFVVPSNRPNNRQRYLTKGLPVVGRENGTLQTVLTHFPFHLRVGGGNFPPINGLDPFENALVHRRPSRGSPGAFKVSETGHL